MGYEYDDKAVTGVSRHEKGGSFYIGDLDIFLQSNLGDKFYWVSDDGRGISRTAVATKAVANGLVTQQQLMQMSDEDVYKLIFSAGVSTAAAVTEISGRGVGMGAVKAAVEAVGGNISIVSRAGHGTTFTLEMPKVASVGRQKRLSKLSIAQ